MMKKRNLIQMVLCVAFAVLLLCGCGNSKEESPVSEAGTEVEADASAEGVGEATDAQTAGDAGKADEIGGANEAGEADGADKADKAEAEDGQAEEYKEMPVATVATTVSDPNAFLDYTETLKDPALLIYNENEGYVINMGEGEYYQLKKDGRIFEYLSERGVESSDTLEAGGGTNFAKVDKVSYVYEMKPDYTIYDSPHKVLYVVGFVAGEDYTNPEEYFLLTCYLDAPKE